MSMPRNKGLVLLALVVAVLAASLLAAALGLIPTSVRHGDHSLQVDHEVLAADSPQPSPHRAILATSCRPSAVSSSSAVSLQHMLFRARQLAEQQLSADAVAEFHNIAAVDPALPGLNLNISMAMMQLKHTEEAKAAIDAQLAMSDCVATLSPADFAAYCHSEMSLQTIDSCRQQTQEIRRTAHMQAALVEMELGRSLQPAEAIPVARSVTPSVTPSVSPQRTASAPAAAPRKHPVDDSLAHGTGTDAALGAYSK